MPALQLPVRRALERRLAEPRRPRRSEPFATTRRVGGREDLAWGTRRVRWGAYGWALAMDGWHTRVHTRALLRAMDGACDIDAGWLLVFRICFSFGVGGQYRYHICGGLIRTRVAILLWVVVGAAMGMEGVELDAQTRCSGRSSQSVGATFHLSMNMIPKQI